jgi:hypothetical protein
MKYLRALIDRFGKALRIKTVPQAQPPASANHLGSVQAPLQQDRP